MPELMIAIVVISVGLLSLATGSVGVLRQMRDGNQSAQAAIMAQKRLEKMRSMGCNSLSSGTASSGSMSEKWTYAQDGTTKGMAVVESVTYVPREGKSRTFAITSVVPCA